ncbi:MAG TPA: STAS domain-containing protein [Phycisphaerales bacterium]|nr:STAS domain-containing protein [Phycisphaerales bacterium]
MQSELRGQARTVLVVVLPAKLVDETAEPVREAVRTGLPNADGAGVVLDCAAVGLINSLGITCLLQVQDHCRKRGAPLVLAGVPDGIVAFLSRLKLDARFPRAASVDEAVVRIDRGAA